MFKKLLLLAAVLLIAGAPNAFAAEGIFEFNTDIGTPTDPLGIGSTVYTATDRYLLTAGGTDIWANADQFHYAYNEVSGNYRIQMDPTFQDSGWNDWAKFGVMLRDTTDAGSINYFSFTRKGPGNPWDISGTYGEEMAVLAQREVTDAGSSDFANWAIKPTTVAVQVVNSNGFQVIQGLVDQGDGAGWEVINTKLGNLGDNYLAGIALTAHDNAWLIQGWADNVKVDTNPSLIGIKQAGDPLAEACTGPAGFKVSAAKLPDGWAFWDDGDGGNGDARADKYAQAEYLVKNSGLVGYTDAFGTVAAPAAAREEGSKIVDLVNLYDTGGPTGGRWAFTGDTEVTFPGIDAHIVNPEEPADGDDDQQFGVLVEACIELTEGLHVIGGAFDDGVLVRIGGVEIGRTNAWNESGMWLFNVAVAGHYSLEAVGYEEGGGAGLELYEFLPDGTKILMGDVANGGSPVHVPEPATIALLGFGGLSMLRIRKKR